MPTPIHKQTTGHVYRAALHSSQNNCPNISMWMSEDKDYTLCLADI